MKSAMSYFNAVSHNSPEKAEKSQGKICIAGSLLKIRTDYLSSIELQLSKPVGWGISCLECSLGKFGCVLQA
jgi:hypothetical protein